MWHREKSGSGSTVATPVIVLLRSLVETDATPVIPSHGQHLQDAPQTDLRFHTVETRIVQVVISIVNVSSEQSHEPPDI